MNEGQKKETFYEKNKYTIGISLMMVSAICIITYELTVVPHQLNDSIDWNEIDKQIKTNQTLTNSWNCDNVQFYYAEAKMLVITPHPEIVKDFHDLGVKKGCAFAESTP